MHCIYIKLIGSVVEWRQKGSDPVELFDPPSFSVTPPAVSPKDLQTGSWGFMTKEWIDEKGLCIPA